MTTSILSEQDLPDSDSTPRLTYAQHHRRNAGLQLHRQRQLLYPKDPADPRNRLRIRRMSPQRQARLLAVPRDTATPLHHICVEHPQEHPNEFLYLYLLNPANHNGARVFAWVKHAPTSEDAKGYAILARTYTSVYAAITHVSRQGFLDASW